MATPRVTVDESLAVSRVTVADTAPRVVVSETGSTTGIQVTASSDVVSVVLSQSAAGVTSVNGQTGAVTGIATSSGVAASIAAIDFPVDSVNGKTNTVVLTTSDIAEGSNEYYTSTRANSAFDTRLATKTTDNLSEGSTNKYFTTSQARAAISVSGSLSYDSGTGVVSYTTPTTIASISNHTTTDLAEGTNLYFTDQRARDAVGGSSITINPGRWNSPYTQNSAIRGYAQWAASGNSNLTIFNTSSLNDTTALTVTGHSTHTNPLQKWTASGSTVASISPTGVLTADSLSLTTYPSTTDITEGTRLYYTDARADARVAVGIANLVDSAPGTLDTLNELAAALGDDPNFATTVTTALGNKLNTSDFNSTFDTRLATKTTSNLTEGTNLYYTDARARASNSGGTGVTYDSGTGVIAIGQIVATSADVVFNSVDANITNGNYILGQIIASPNTSYTPPASALTTVTGSNGITIASSTGNNATVSMRYSSGDTSAGVNTSAAIIMAGSSGTSTSPGGNGANQVLGSLNFDGYTAGTSNGWAQQIATANQGAGLNAISPLQAQGYARQAFTNSTIISTSVTGASGTGSVATLTFTTQNTPPYQTGQTVTIAGMTPSGYNGTYVLTAATVSSISYANATTGFTSGGAINSANTVTAAGTGFRVRGFPNSTNLTLGNRINFMDLTSSAAAFKADAYTFADGAIPGATTTSRTYLSLTSTSASFASAGNTYANLTATNTAFANGGVTYANMNAGSSTFTVTGFNSFIRQGTVNSVQPGLVLRYSRTDTTGSNDNDGVDFRLGTGGTSTTDNIARFDAQYKATGLHTVGIAVSVDSFTADSTRTAGIYRGSAEKTLIRAMPTGGSGVGTTVDVLTVETAKITAAAPVVFPNYTAVAARALTGAVGWQICISNSAQGSNPNGMMAFWDTTNSRWSYVHDNSAV